MSQGPRGSRSHGLAAVGLRFVPAFKVQLEAE